PADVRVLHVLNRAGFGPRPGDAKRVADLTVGRYLDEQLQPDMTTLPSGLRARLDGLPTLGMEPLALFDRYERPIREARGDPEAQQAARRAAQIVRQEAVQARILRALESPWQLHEVMTAFWFNHFNVFAGKGLDRLWIGHYEAHAIRPH